MWFLLRKEDYCCGDTSYELYGRDEIPDIKGFKVELRPYTTPENHTQKLSTEYKHYKKTNDDKVWERSEAVKTLNSLPDGHEEWLNHTFTEENGNIYHKYDLQQQGWFIELNTLEDFIKLDKEYVVSMHRWFEDTPYEINMIDTNA